MGASDSSPGDTELVSQVQAGVARARKVVRAESGAAKARMKLIRRAAGSKTKGVLAGAQAKVAQVRKAVRGAVQKAVGKKASATGETFRKAAAGMKGTFAGKSPVTRKTETRKRRGVKVVRKVARKKKR